MTSSKRPNDDPSAAPDASWKLSMQCPRCLQATTTMTLAAVKARTALVLVPGQTPNATIQVLWTAPVQALYTEEQICPACFDALKLHGRTR